MQFSHNQTKLTPTNTELGTAQPQLVVSIILLPGWTDAGPDVLMQVLRLCDAGKVGVLFEMIDLIVLLNM